MKKLLVFFHGFGFDKNNNKEFIDKLADNLDADVFSFNALYPSMRERGGYSWCNHEKINGKRVIIFDDDFNKSVEYILDTINKEVKKREISWDDLIFCGRSQGAFMANFIGLTTDCNPQMIISLCGLWADNLDITTKINKNVPLYWIEAKYDDVLSRERMDTYKILQDMGCNIKYIIDDNSDHDNLDEGILRLLHH